ncbi:MAG: thioredoxin family protein [Candidatus Omnitrophota bacterium]
MRLTRFVCSVAFIAVMAVVVSFFGVPEARAATSAEGKKELLKLGSEAPDFALPDVVTGKVVRRDDLKDSKALLVVILCRHCPYVKHIRQDLSKLGKDYEGQGLAIVGISANDPAAYPEDGPESLKEMAVSEGFTFPVLFDGPQEVAKAYTAVATPDFLLFDKDRKLVYRGQYDDARPGNASPVTGKDLRAAVDAVLAGNPVPTDQKHAVGCSIKWKK